MGEDNADASGVFADDNRLGSELELLHAMYPDPATISYTPRARELRYHHTHMAADGDDGVGGGGSSDDISGTLILRLPDSYPEAGRPEVLLSSAVGGKQQQDLRAPATEMVRGLYERGEVEDGVEALDAVLLGFRELLASPDTDAAVSRGDDNSSSSTTKFATEVTAGGAHGNVNKNKRKTVVIWLHHLLNTNKRKLALNPSLVTPSSSTAIAASTTKKGKQQDEDEDDDSDPTISGVTKPGYPGVLVYTGPRAAVDAHVAELRAQRWQAFQVRLDSDDLPGTVPWKILSSGGGGSKINEAESMSQVVQSLARPADRDVFLGVMGIR